ncbi:Ff.00g121480.m01.CDS01 [Fusarium sp. VM40]|nr:Ff.00g121480.m01.CDS01 [Fusarium sp. VM40]
MKSTQNLAAAMLFNGVAAGIVKPAIGNETEPNTAKTFVATVTSDHSFYCPEPTAFSHGGVTYTVTEPMYVTITNCPCEVTLTQNPKSPEVSIVPPGPPAPPPQVTAPKPGPPPPAPEQPATGPPPPQVPPTGTAISAVPSAAANKANGNLGALLVAGVAALAILTDI